MSYFKTVIGSAAEGEHYFSRPALDARFWKYIQTGSNILLSAPRRIGKTSFLRHLCDNPAPGYLIKYHTTESINQGNEFFKRLYKSLLEELSTNQSAWNALREITKKNHIEKVGLKGIEIKKADLDYYEEFRLLLNKLTLDQPLIFILDEFSETLVNINKDFGEDAGRLFLHQNRELRQDPVLGKKLHYVYSGSVGLDNIAERMEVSKTINDLREFKMPALKPTEGKDLVSNTQMEGSPEFPDEVVDYLLEKIHWLLPFYVMIVLDELENVLMEEEATLVTRKHVDQAFAQSLDNRTYFEHWSTRLRITYTGHDFTYAKDVLNTAAADPLGIPKGKAYDLAMKNKLPDDYASILRSLEYDGYLTRDEAGTYLFQSPLLKAWWLKNVTV